MYRAKIHFSEKIKGRGKRKTMYFCGRTEEELNERILNYLEKETWYMRERPTYYYK